MLCSQPDSYHMIGSQYNPPLQSQNTRITDEWFLLSCERTPRRAKSPKFSSADLLSVPVIDMLLSIPNASSLKSLRPKERYEALSLSPECESVHLSGSFPYSVVHSVRISFT